MPAKRPTKEQLREQLDREVANQGRQFGVSMADKGQGPYSVDPTLSPKQTKPPNNKGSVEPGAPVQTDKVAVIPTASYDPIRSQGNWAPLRPAPEPIPGIVPGFNPDQPMMGTAQWGGTGTPITAGFLTTWANTTPRSTAATRC